MKINELPLREELLKAVEKMGYREPTPVQAQVLPLLLAGTDVECEAPTGTGKTACYSLPLLNGLKPGAFVQGLVVCPTRELARQVVAETAKFGQFLPHFKTVAIYGGQSVSIQVRALKGHPSVVVGTPGRLLDLIGSRSLDVSHVTYLVLDECDEMLDMGFIRDIDRILASIRGPHQTSLFSATISPEIKRISRKFLKPDFKGVRIVRDLAHQQQIAQRYVMVEESAKKEALVALLSTLSFARAFVFCRTKHKVMQIAKVLAANTDHDITSLQGNLSQNHRDRNMDAFRSNACDVMVATDIAARGIDVSDVDLVVNYDVPEDDEFYLHRIGRTGRVEAKGTSYTFLTHSQRGLIRKYETLSGNPLSAYVIDPEAFRDHPVAPLPPTKPFETRARSGEDRSRRHGDHSGGHGDHGAGSSDSQRFFINLGTKDGLDETGLTDFVSTCQPALAPGDYTDVFLRDSYSFFAVAKAKAAHLEERLAGREYNGRAVNIEAAKPRAAGNSQRSHGHGGFGYHHGGGSYRNAGPRDSHHRR